MTRTRAPAEGARVSCDDSPLATRQGLSTEALSQSGACTTTCRLHETAHKEAEQLGVSLSISIHLLGCCPENSVELGTNELARGEGGQERCMGNRGLRRDPRTWASALTSGSVIITSPLSPRKACRSSRELDLTGFSPARMRSKARVTIRLDMSSSSRATTK